jgi:hypothetical protein
MFIAALTSVWVSTVKLAPPSWRGDARAYPGPCTGRTSPTTCQRACERPSRPHLARVALAAGPAHPQVMPAGSDQSPPTHEDLLFPLAATGPGSRRGAAARRAVVPPSSLVVDLAGAVVAGRGRRRVVSAADQRAAQLYIGGPAGVRRSTAAVPARQRSLSCWAGSLFRAHVS